MKTEKTLVNIWHTGTLYRVIHQNVRWKFYGLLYRKRFDIIRVMSFLSLPSWPEVISSLNNLISPQLEMKELKNGNSKVNKAFEYTDWWETKYLYCETIH